MAASAKATLPLSNSLAMFLSPSYDAASATLGCPLRR
jgi:hypothetical protein